MLENLWATRLLSPAVPESINITGVDPSSVEANPHDEVLIVVFVEEDGKSLQTPDAPQLVSVKVLSVFTTTKTGFFQRF